MTDSTTTPVAAADLDDDEFVWTSPPFQVSNNLHLGLRELDKEMRCPICKGFFTVPMSLETCKHTFCSQCIRTAIRQQTESTKRIADCPVCRQAIELSGGVYPLVHNRTAGIIVQKFQEIRASLFTTLQAGVCSVTTDTGVTDQPIEGGANVVAAAAAAPGKVKTPSSASSAQRVTRASTASAEQVAPDSSEGKENSDPLIVAPPPRRLKKLPKFYYTGKKRKDLQKMCRDYGLGVGGNEHELKERHKKFVHLYTSECDSDQPRSMAELVKFFNQEERAIRREEHNARFNGVSEHAVIMKRLKESRKVAGEDNSAAVSSGDPKFDRLLDDNFKKLAAETRRRMKEEKQSRTGVSPSSEEEQGSTVKSQPQTVNTVDSTVNGISKATKSNTPDPAEVRKPPSAPVAVPLHVEDHSSGAASPALPTLPSQSRPVARLPSVSSHGSNGSCSHSEMMVMESTPASVKSRKRKSPETSSPSIIGPWSCAACTFFNKTRTWSRATCEVCESPRSKN